MKRGNWRSRKAYKQDALKRRGATPDYMGQYLIGAAKRGEKIQRTLLQKMTGQR